MSETNDEFRPMTEQEFIDHMRELMRGCTVNYIHGPQGIRQKRCSPQDQCRACKQAEIHIAAAQERIRASIFR